MLNLLLKFYMQNKHEIFFYDFQTAKKIVKIEYL